MWTARFSRLSFRSLWLRLFEDFSNVLFFKSILHYKALEICYFFKVIYFFKFIKHANPIKHLILLTTIQFSRTLVNNLLISKFEWKSNLGHKLRIFRNSKFKHKMKILQIPQELVHEKFYVYEKIFRTQNCRRKFIKNLIPEKSKKNV